MVTKTKGREMEQWQIEMLQELVKESSALANSDDMAGSFFTGRAQAFRLVLDLFAGTEGGSNG